MNIAINAKRCVKLFGHREAFALVKAAGFDAVDYDFSYHEGNWLLEDDYLEQAARIRRDLDETGLVCRQTHAPFEGGTFFRGLIYGDPFTEECPEYLQTVRAMEASVILGAEHTVIHDLDVPDGVDNVEYNYHFYKSLQPYAEKYNIQIAIENLCTNKYLRMGISKFPDRIGTAEKLNTLLRRLDSDRFVVLVDTGHAKLAEVPLEELIRGLTPGSLKGLHIHDTDTTGDRHQLPYMCSGNWAKVMTALKDVNYQGDITFEVSMNKIPQALLKDFLTYTAAVGRYFAGYFDKP